ncbi:MAG: NHLP family bacteriocin export ABC transporter peptidase/permease/ATPase subunit [Deferribacterales bacterium]
MKIPFISSGTKNYTKTPTTLQMEAVECGAACLAMILDYHGLKVPLEIVRQDCGVSRNGSKASNMVKAARKYGLDARGYRKEVGELQTMKMPVIIFWNFNHFVVLEGFRNGKAVLNDPGVGRRFIEMDDFDDSYTGVTLTFKPTKSFVRGGESGSMYKALLERFRGSEIAAAYVILAGLFLVIPGLVIPAFSKIFVDSILVGGMDDWLRPLLFGMAATFLVRGGLTWLQQYYLLRFETKLATVSTAKFLIHVLRLPITFFAQRMPGEIVSRIQLNDVVANLIANQLTVNVINLMMVVFYTAVMFYYDVMLTITGILIALINIGMLKLVSSKRIILNQKFQMEGGKLIGISMSGLSMIEPLKASGGESDFFAKWAGQQAKVINTQQQLAVPTQLLMVMTPFLMSVNTVVVLGFGGLKVMNGEMTLGMLVAFQSLMASFMTPFNQIVNMGSTLQQTVSDVNRLDDAMRYKEDIRFSESHVVSMSDKLEGGLELKDISFGYSSLEEPLIREFSVKLNKGQRVAIVGGSGSGKSTVAKLVSGLYEPWGGEILYDGYKIREIEDSALYDSIAMVDQDIFMFEGTVRDNITMWDSTISDADVLKAAKDACIHEDVAIRPGAYRSRVEEGGGNFSGGQRQRLEIARALVRNPSILILDEATSALDAQTEMDVVDNIRKRGVTCLIVAHRLSTIRDSDEIIVMDNGLIVQRGTHESMISGEDKPYAQLIRSY